jgi:ADP-heptose:LPS heptosyltransferase
MLTTTEPKILNKIAVLNFGGIGDELLFSPVLQDLRTHFPKAHITLFLEDRSAGIGPLLPGVDTLSIINVQQQSRVRFFGQMLKLLKNGYYDVVLASGSSPFISVLLWLSRIPIRVGFDVGPLSRKLLTIPVPLHQQGYAAQMYAALSHGLLAQYGQSHLGFCPEKPILGPFQEEDTSWAKVQTNAWRTTSREALNKPLVLLHPGVSKVSQSKKMFKHWAPESWAALITQLAPYYQLVLIGGPDDQDAVAQIEAYLQQQGTPFINAYGVSKNLKQLAALLAYSDALLCVDSAPLHLAVALNKPVVCMFGPTDPHKLIPRNGRFAAVHRQDLYCQPCLWDRRKISCPNPVCLEVPVSAMAQALLKVTNMDLQAIRV